MAMENPNPFVLVVLSEVLAVPGCGDGCLLPAVSHGNCAWTLHLPERLQQSSAHPALRSAAEGAAKRQPKGLVCLCPQQDPLPAGKTLGLGEMCDLLLTPSPLALQDVKARKNPHAGAGPRRARAGDHSIKMLKMSVLKTDTIGYLKL